MTRYAPVELTILWHSLRTAGEKVKREKRCKKRGPHLKGERSGGEYGPENGGLNVRKPKYMTAMYGKNPTPPKKGDISKKKGELLKRGILASSSHQKPEAQQQHREKRRDSKDMNHRPKKGRGGEIWKWELGR